MSQYLIFVKKINEGIYRFDFSNDAETAWGEHWNDTPAANDPNIAPERNAISNSYRIELTIDFITACDNTCFSMQDCIDGIIALAFTDIDDKENVVLPFGYDYDSVMNEIKDYIKSITELELDGENVIEGLIDDLDGGNSNE